MFAFIPAVTLACARCLIQASPTAVQPPTDNVTLTTIKAYMRIIVIDYKPPASLKYLQRRRSVEGREKTLFGTVRFIQTDSSHEL